jgi:hypothetical protein
MEGLIFITLPTLLLLVLAVGLLAFFDVAFCRLSAAPRQGALQQPLSLRKPVPRPQAAKRGFRDYHRPWIPQRPDTRVGRRHTGRRAHT